MRLCGGAAGGLLLRDSMMVQVFVVAKAFETLRVVEDGSAVDTNVRFGR